MDGAVLLVDKQTGWTSHDVVARARRCFGTRKVGHAGTLDPLATGLLLLGVGPATRLLTHLVGLDKVYQATIRLGQTTVTEDSEGDVTATAASAAVRELAVDFARVRAAAGDLTGEIMQVPSSVSAIKVQGKRAYDLVRAGEAVELAARQVTIRGFELGEPALLTTAAGDTVLDVPALVECSSGTYIRALARDLGEGLGVGAHLTALRRVSVGPFAVSAALPGEELAGFAARVAAGEVSPAGLWDGGEGIAALLSPAAVAAALFPQVQLSAGQALALSQGKVVTVAAENTKLAAALSPGGRLVGLARVKRGEMRAVTNFPVPSAWDGVA